MKDMKTKSRDVVVLVKDCAMVPVLMVVPDVLMRLHLIHLVQEEIQ